MKIIFTLLAAILLTGCRTARPTVMSEESTDSVKIFTDTSISISHDSIIISEKSGMHTDDTIEFVDGGGIVYVSTDGTVSMYGVTAVSASRLKFSEKREETGSTDIQAHSKDSVVAIHHVASYSESKPMASAASYGWKMKCAALVLFGLMIMMLIAKINRNKINH